MTLKKQFEALIPMLDKTGKEINKAQLAAKLMQLQADLIDDDVAVPSDVFEPFTEEARRMAAIGFLLVIAQGLQG